MQIFFYFWLYNIVAHQIFFSLELFWKHAGVWTWTITSMQIIIQTRIQNTCIV